MQIFSIYSIFFFKIRHAYSYLSNSTIRYNIISSSFPRLAAWSPQLSGAPRADSYLLPVAPAVSLGSLDIPEHTNIIHCTLHKGQAMKSSLPYQLLLYLGSYYFGCYLCIEILLLIYKSIILPYKSFTLFSEVIG